MKLHHCSNPECGRPFQVNEFKTRIPLPFEYGKIRCPHCGNASPADPGIVFRTHALSEQEEHDFVSFKKLPARLKSSLRTSNT
jgi:DNA-directed RNA polymerase subunit RPC12/RpoP